MLPHLPIEILKSKSDNLNMFGGTDKSQVHAVYIGEIEVKPKEQPRMHLGIYEKALLPVKVLLVVNPGSEIGTVNGQITIMEKEGSIDIYLYIANYGDKIVSAEIWSI